MKDKLQKAIDAEQEVLSVMPLKTRKNKIAYIKALEELQKKYQKQLKNIKTEIIARCDDIKNVYESEELNEINIRITNLGSNLYLINKYLDSFEKLGLDRITYGLNHFYKENLIRVNKLILKAINIFKDVGIELTPAYFDYSHYTYEYMQVFFKEMVTDLKSELLRNTFESIYWKCPDIIIHLDLNIKYLYFLNEDKIDNYLKNKKEEFLSLEKNDESKIIEVYSNLIRKRDSIASLDGALILKDFLSKKVAIADYDQTKINKAYDKIIIDKDYFDQNKAYVNENIIKLEYSLREYRDYLSFKFIIDDIKVKFNEKDSYKNLYKNKLKEITKSEDDLRNKNYKIFKMKNSKLPNIEKIENALNETENLIMENKKKYDELDDFVFKDKILNKITINSTYYDVLCLALSNYSYLTNKIKANETDITEDEVKLKVFRLQTLLNSPYNTIINNINILDEKNIANIIVDRYRLLNINVNEENILEENLDDLINTVHNIVYYLHICNSGVTLDNIFYVVNAMPITK